jgi:hypothetical protein
MATEIGFQSGIKAAMNALRKELPVYTAAWDKLERTLKILADDHDAAIVDPAPEDPPPPPPPPSGPVAPRTYNTAPGGEPSARFCVAGLPRNQNGRLHDIYSEYDDDGHDLGGRTTLLVPGLKFANEMDGRGPCDPYGSFPPWPAESDKR